MADSRRWDLVISPFRLTAPPAAQIPRLLEAPLAHLALPKLPFLVRGIVEERRKVVETSTRAEIV